MKNRQIFCWISAVILLTCLSRSGMIPTAEAVAGNPGAVLSVDELMKNVDRYQGTVQVEGVVSGVSPGEQTLALISTQEFQDCSVTTCARLYLPVRWTGTMPAVHDAVQLTGVVQKADGKLIFTAHKLEKIKTSSHKPK